MSAIATRRAKAQARHVRAQLKAGFELARRGWRCQFCGFASLPEDWKAGGDRCPKCRRAYDAQLAQDGDDE